MTGKKVIYYTRDDTELRENTKHVVHFFGILGCIKVNVLGQDISKKQEGKFNIVDYYFDYPGFSKIVNPERFQKELKDGEKRFTRVIISLWLCSFILSTTSVVLSYLAHSNQKSKKVIAGLVTASVVLSIIASVFLVAGLLWIFFDSVKKKLVIHKIESQLKDLDPELVKKYKNMLVGEKQATNEGANDQELEKTKNIEEILQFFLERKKILALFKFLTNGEKLVQAGMAMVNDLLLKNVHPNDIVLDTNSLGGGIAAEVLRRFEAQGIYLTLIHSNSYSSLNDVANTFKKPFHVKCLNILHKFFGLELNSEKVIENTKCPVLITNRKGDSVIEEPAQLAGKLPDLNLKNEKRLRRNVIFEHHPEKKEDCKIKDIHTDYRAHLVYKSDSGNVTEYISCEKVIGKFLDEADDYLKSYKLNEGFNLKKHGESDFSKSFTEIKLVLISDKMDNSVPCIG